MPKTKLFVQVGQRLGRGVVVDADVRIPRPGRTASRGARLICDCGNEYVSAISALIGNRPENQLARSCGCLRRERQIASATTHGMNSHPLAKTWDAMIDRCENPHANSYESYGGRGIRVCERWHDIRLFIEDIERDLGPRSEGMSLDRYPDNDGNYEPGNVRWATAAQQAQNRRPSQGMSDRARSFWDAREPRTLVCEQCGDEYESRAVAGNLRFCSKKCKAANRRANRLDNVERTCHQCGGIFTANRYDATRHCSQSCAATCQHAGNCPAKEVV